MQGNTGILTRYGIILKPVTTATDKLRESSQKHTNALINQMATLKGPARREIELAIRRSKQQLTSELDVAKATDKQATAHQALAALQQRFSGQAESYGKTQQGAADRAKASWEEVRAAIGEKLAPVLKGALGLLTKFAQQLLDGKGVGGQFVKVITTIGSVLGELGKKVGQVVGWFKQNKTAVELLIGALKVGTAAWVAYRTAVLLAAAAQALFTGGGTIVAFVKLIGSIRSLKDAWILLDAAMDANLFGLIVAAVAALAAGLYILYTRSATARKIMDGTWKALRTAAETVFPVVKKLMEIGLIGPIGIVITNLHSLEKVVKSVFGSMKHVVSDFVDFWLGAVSSVLGGISSMLTAAGHLPGVGGKFKEAAKAIDKVRDAIDNMRGKLHDANKPINTVKGNIKSLGGVASDTAGAVINDLNAALGAMGAKKLSIHVGHSGAHGAATDLGAPDIGGFSTHAGGGIPHPGSGSRDDHILVDPRGRPVAAMSGTEGILNTPQMGIVDYALGGMAAMGLLPPGMGGLGQLWGSGMTHYAGGGVLGRANLLEQEHLPYIWGGHHGEKGPIRDPRPGLDCSSTVSYVLGIPPRMSGAFENYGSPGTGKGIDIFANAGHVFMRIAGRMFGTSRSNPGGGPGWIADRSTAGFVARTTDAAGAGFGDVTAPSVTGSSAIGVAMGRASGKLLAKAANSYLGKQIGSLDNAGGQPAADGTGAYSKSELAHLWSTVNPGLGNPRLMAAIALAESGGDPSIVNSIGAGGLWQINPPEPGYLNPTTNASIAGRKLRTQGLRAWEAFTNGSYRQFLARGGLLGFASGGNIATGTGDLGPDINHHAGAHRTGKQERAWLSAQWAKVAPFFGTSAKADPFSGLFKHVLLSRNVPFVGDASDPDAKGHETDELLWPSWLWRQSGFSVKGRRETDAALDDRTKLKLFIHEMAHRFQSRRATGSAWKAEGGAEAFARLMMARHFGGYPASQNRGDPYNGDVGRVRKLGQHWILKTQFGRARGGLLPRFAGGGALHASQVASTRASAQHSAAVGQAKDPYHLGVLSHPVKTGVKEYDTLKASLADQQTHYGQVDRAYGQSDEVFINPDTGALDMGAIHHRVRELDKLLALRQRIVATIEHMRAVMSRIIASLHYAIARTQAALAAARKKDRPALKKQLAGFKASLPDHISELHQLGFDVIDARLDVGDIRKEKTGVLGTQPELKDTTSTDGSGGGSTDTSTGGGITADQQAQINQAAALKAIVERGTFLDSTSAGILGGTINPQAAGGVQWNNLNPGAIGQAVTPALAAKAAAMGVDLNAPVGGTAGGSAGGNVQVVFNTAFPPSPQQAEEAARGVVAGLSYQGSVNSPRTSLGV
jgi:hypothetical protein